MCGFFRPCCLVGLEISPVVKKRENSRGKICHKIVKNWLDWAFFCAGRHARTPLSRGKIN